MIEIILKDGGVIYIPLARIVEISQAANGYVIATSDVNNKTHWHNASAFTIMREGQRISL